MLWMEFFVKSAVFIILLEYSATGWIICPRTCECKDQIVDCSHRGFKEFPTYFPSNAEYLNLTGNELRYLPDTVYNLQSLAHLSLAWNQLHYIPETTLQRLWELETLDLTGNKFNRLSDIHGVSYSSKLSELKLQNNPIKETGTCAIEESIYSESIYKLDLTKCILTDINPCAFLWMTNLTHLYLSENPLQQLTQIISPTIEHLYVSNCDIHFVTAQAFDKLPSLKYLDISKNPNLKVHTPFNNIYMSESLVNLDASNCGMTELIISPFPNLKQASFKGNFIRELPPRLLYHNQYLSYIDLSENLISLTHYGTFINGDSLIDIDLSSNFITDFHPGTFSHLYRLKKLNISRNPLKTLNNISAVSLQQLDANDCDIRELNSLTFFNMPNILQLNISNNPIEYLPNDLRLDSLKELDLSYCRILMINYRTFDKLTKLKKLDLRGNRLTNTFHRPLLESMKNIEEIIITNNPWQCRCNSTEHAEFLSFVEKRSPSVDQQGLTCLKPDTQLQVIWSKACQIINTKSEKRYKAERHWTAFLITFAVMSSIVLVLLVLRHNLFTTPDSNTTEGNTEATEPGSAPYPVRSPIADILMLPTYEEAILLPKPAVTVDPLYNRTREVATWTSNLSLNNINGDNAIANENDDEYNENCSLHRHYDSVNASSTSL